MYGIFATLIQNGLIPWDIFPFETIVKSSALCKWAAGALYVQHVLRIGEKKTLM
jgi:hypothetical protein